MTDSRKDQNIFHVSPLGSDERGTGSPDAPFATVSKAAESCPESVILVHEGTYGRVRFDSRCSGTDDSPTVIRAAEGERAVFRCAGGACIHLVNVGNIVLEGLETEGGTHGIRYESTREAGNSILANITLRNCTIHGVRGVHGICVYARRDTEPVRNFTIGGCHVFDCECGSSESVVLNGNIDGFLVAGCVIHDNNNIGIDMIGFEGTARHQENAGFKNLYDADFVRNGQCHDNIVFNISTKGNPAYREKGGYDLSAGGIYVDGGQDIEIYNNFVFNCDIGLEVATEHSPDDNELFKVNGIKIHDNVVADCKGWCGLSFGGYDRNLGFTENCEFTNNTFVDNEMQVSVQRSKDNKIQNNLFVGGGDAIAFNEDCKEKDLINSFGRNIWCVEDGSLENHISVGDYDIDVLLPNGTLKKQNVLSNRDEVIDGFTSLIEGAGSEFVPGEGALKLYNENNEH